MNPTGIRTLDHAGDECVGGWQLVQVPAGYVWRCERCHRLYPATLDTSRRVTWDRHLEEILVQLAQEGRRLLGDEA